jgi:hypothetical protein
MLRKSRKSKVQAIYGGQCSTAIKHITGIVSFTQVSFKHFYQVRGFLKPIPKGTGYSIVLIYK